MGILSWLALGAGAAMAPFTGGASLALGGAASAALKGAGNNNNGSSGNWLTGQQIQPNVAPYHVPGALGPWADYLFSSLVQKPDGGWDLKGVPSYEGQLAPKPEDTILPSVWGSWNKDGDASMQWMKKLLENGGFQTPANLQSGLDVMMANGGLGGRPTTAMNDMMQYGGVPGAGLDAMKNLMMYGVASEAGRPMANLAQFGVTGPAGMPLHARATGGPNAAQNFLAAYMPGGKA